MLIWRWSLLRVQGEDIFLFHLWPFNYIWIECEIRGCGPTDIGRIMWLSFGIWSGHWSWATPPVEERCCWILDIPFFLEKLDQGFFFNFWHFLVDFSTEQENKFLSLQTYVVAVDFVAANCLAFLLSLVMLAFYPFWFSLLWLIFSKLFLLILIFS